MSRKHPRRLLLSLTAAALVLAATGTDPATGNPSGSEQFTAAQIAAGSTVTAPKAPTSKLAQSDPELLARSDSQSVNVLVKLDYDSTATFEGGQGYAATSPQVTGQQLTGATAAEQAYEGLQASKEQQFAADLAQAVPGATINGSLRTVYGGVEVTVPAAAAKTVAALPGVVAVQDDDVRHLLTDSSPGFIGAPTLWGQEGGQANAGAGVIYGNLDTGIWPEHPSFTARDDPGAPARPTRPDGTEIGCDYGDNPLTPAPDPFECNNKLIGGYPFLTTYLSNPDRAAAEPFHTARDSNGHGTHTSSTSGGNIVENAEILGRDRGPITGLAPGVHVIEYKVCGIEGCFPSDSAAAVQRAILDGVDVINFSISGGTSPLTDPVELAFLDAYAAGVFVAASAGNEGPDASTANHLSPWVTTVAASTQSRKWQSTLTLSSGGGATLELTGTAIRPDGAGPLPVVLAEDVPGYDDPLCIEEPDPGVFTGMIVGCKRGPGRAAKGFNVLQGGGAGMILYNAPGDLFPEMSDTHHLPAIHTEQGEELLDFLADNTGVTGTFTAGEPTLIGGDEMAAFSSRGPAGPFIKPDITAPGVQILAGNTPVPDDVAGGPPGQYFQSIGGTSMSGPHIAGSALLVKALHPEWTPGQIKSALMTTANRGVVKEDGVTPADPFDYGSGRVNLNLAGNPGLTFDETAARYAALTGDPVHAVDLNLPSVNATVMPGSLTTHRFATNVTTRSVKYQVTASTIPGASITVTPSVFSLGAGKTIDLTIKIKGATLPEGTHGFGVINLIPNGSNTPTRLHLPVSFVKTQGAVGLTSSCTPTTVKVGGLSTCTVTATNLGFGDTTADLATMLNTPLTIQSVSGINKQGLRNASVNGVSLSGQVPGNPSVDPGASPAGFLPLARFGITPDAIGDEEIINYDVPDFVYSGVTYNRVGVDSNGYIVVGGGTAEDNDCCNPLIPSPSRPNNVLAPFWTDLDGTGAPGILAAALSDGVNSWLVIEWQVNVFGTTSNRHFQVWIGLDATQDITYAYDPAALPADPEFPFVVGAENVNGSAGDTLATGVLPTEDLRVTSSAPTPGGSYTYTVTVKGASVGTGVVRSTMVSPAVPGTTVALSEVRVRAPGVANPQ